MKGNVGNIIGTLIFCAICLFLIFLMMPDENRWRWSSGASSSDYDDSGCGTVWRC